MMEVIEEGAPLHRIYNIGNNQPIKLKEFIACIEETVGKKAEKNYTPMQDGDVVRTHADIDSFKEITGCSPETNLEEGIAKLVEWYQKNQTKVNLNE